MAGGKSAYLEDKVLDDLYGSGAPASIYIALYTVTVGDDGAGGTEVSTGDWTNYARKAVTNNNTNFPAASAGVKKNGAIIDFGTATCSSPVTVAAFATFDAVAGNMLHWGPISPNKVVSDGDPVTIPIDGLSISED